MAITANITEESIQKVAPSYAEPGFKDHWHGTPVTREQLSTFDSAADNCSLESSEGSKAVCETLDFVTNEKLIMYGGTQDFINSTFQDLVDSICDYNNKLNNWLVDTAGTVRKAFETYQNNNRCKETPEEREEEEEYMYYSNGKQCIGKRTKKVIWHIDKTHGGGAGPCGEHKESECPN